MPNTPPPPYDPGSPTPPRLESPSLVRLMASLARDVFATDDSEVELVDSISRLPNLRVSPFINGYCYLFLFREDHWSFISWVYGSNPRVLDLLRSPDVLRETSCYRAMTITRTSSFREDPIFHLESHSTDAEVWGRLGRAAAQFPNARLGFSSRLQNRPTSFGLSLTQPFCDSFFLLGAIESLFYFGLPFTQFRAFSTLLFFFYVLGLFSFPQLLLLSFSVFCVLFILSPSLKPLTVRRTSQRFSQILLSLRLLPFGDLASDLALLFVGDGDLKFVSLSSLTNSILVFLSSASVFLDLVASLLAMIGDLVGSALTASYSSLYQIVVNKSFQAEDPSMHPFLKTGLQILSLFLKFLAYSSKSPNKKRKYEKMSRHLHTISNVDHLAELFLDIQELVPSFLRAGLGVAPTTLGAEKSRELRDSEELDSLFLPDDSTPSGDDDDQPLDPIRPFQSETSPTPDCKHNFSKVSIKSARKILDECMTGKVHMVTAATGAGKSTHMIVSLSQMGKRPILVTIPTIAACRSAAKGIKDMYALTPHVRSGGKSDVGNCEIYLMTTRAFLVSLFFAPDRFSFIENFVFDEMHVPNADNYVLRHLSKTWKSNRTLVWTSATFTSSFVLPSDSQFTVTEVVSKEVVPSKVFTEKCSIPELSFSGLVGRYLFFMASTVECSRFASRFDKAGVVVHVITSKTFETGWPKAYADLESPRSVATVVIATNVLETGTTAPFDYVVDFAHKMSTKLTPDPLALSLVKTPVTQGESVQRKGRVGRLFDGKYFRPPVEFSTDPEVVDSDYGMALLLSHVLRVPPPTIRHGIVLDSKRITDHFFFNVMGSMLDPFSVLGMTDSSGRFFQCFKNFDFPVGSRVDSLYFNKFSLPLATWKSWPSHSVRPWEYKTSSGELKSGKSIRAPFFDYSKEEYSQVLNWHQNVVVDDQLSGFDDELLSRYNKVSYSKIRAVSQKMFQMPSRSRSGSRSSRSSGDTEEHDHGQVCQGCGLPLCCSCACETPDPPSFERVGVPIGGRVFHSRILNFLLSLDGLICCIILGSLYHTFCLRRKSNSDVVDGRMLEKAPTFVPVPRDGKPKRPYEGRDKSSKTRGKRSGADVYAELEDFDLVDVWDYKNDRVRIRAEDLDRWMIEDEERAEEWLKLRDPLSTSDQNFSSWADEVDDDVILTSATRVSNRGQHRVSFVDRGGREFDDFVSSPDFDSESHFESLLPVFSPKYPVRTCRSNIVELHDGPAGPFGGFGFRNRMALLVNNHVLGSLGDSLSFFDSGSRKSFRPTVVYRSGDLCVLRLPTSFSAGRFGGTFRPPRDGEKVCLMRLTRGDGGGIDAIPSEIAIALKSDTSMFSYRVSTKPGDCGLPVVAVSDGSVVGIHAMGGSISDGCNYFEPLDDAAVGHLLGRSFQSLDSASVIPWSVENFFSSNGSAVLDPDRQNKVPINPLSGVQDSVTVPSCFSSFTVIGTVRKYFPDQSKMRLDLEAVSALTSKGSFKISDILDYYPSRLSDESYFSDVSKYNRVWDPVPDSVWSRGERYFREYAPWMFGKLEPIDQDAILCRLDMAKSAGARLPVKKGELLSKFSLEEARRFVRACEIVYEAEPSSFSPPLWQVNLKDELRDTVRVAAGKTRTFMSAPIETMVGTARTMGPFNDAFIDNCLKFGSTIGLNKFSSGWDDLAGYLGKQDMMYICGDGSRFDSSLGVQFPKFCAHIRSFSTPKRYRRVLTNAYNEIIWTPLAVKPGLIVVKNGGNPSGQPNTSEDNTMSLIAATVFMFCEIFGEESFFDFHRRGMIRFVCNGDDFLASVHRSLFFQGLNDRMSIEMAKTNLKYDFTTPVDSLEKVVYLSHTFVPWTDGSVVQFWPALSSHRVAATLAFAKSENVFDAVSRYNAVILHAVHYPPLYRIAISCLRRLMKDCGVGSTVLDTSISRRFFYFSFDRICKLYSGYNGGFMNKQQTSQSSYVKWLPLNKFGLNGVSATFFDNFSFQRQNQSEFVIPRKWRATIAVCMKTTWAPSVLHKAKETLPVTPQRLYQPRLITPIVVEPGNLQTFSSCPEWAGLPPCVESPPFLVSVPPLTVFSTNPPPYRLAIVSLSPKRVETKSNRRLVLCEIASKLLPLKTRSSCSANSLFISATTRLARRRPADDLMFSETRLFPWTSFTLVSFPIPGGFGEPSPMLPKISSKNILVLCSIGLRCMVFHRSTECTVLTLPIFAQTSLATLARQFKLLKTLRSIVPSSISCGPISKQLEAELERSLSNKSGICSQPTLRLVVTALLPPSFPLFQSFSFLCFLC